jgi:DNA polymerase delta subunit 2
MFKEWIYGNWDFKTDFAPSNIVRVVIAGNSISSMLQKQMKNTQTSLAKNFDTSDMMESMIVLDQFISQLTESLDVDLMPGEFDPSNCMLPQLPLHYCMFPESGNKKTFQGVSNPYQCEMEGRLILGTSGQNIQDITRFSDITDPLEALKRSLCWSHIAPTCPDTLPCYPYYNEDPFIIENCPHVYFAGNMPEFRTELYKSKIFRNIQI